MGKKNFVTNILSGIAAHTKFKVNYMKSIVFQRSSLFIGGHRFIISVCLKNNTEKPHTVFDQITRELQHEKL